MSQWNGAFPSFRVQARTALSHWMLWLWLSLSWTTSRSEQRSKHPARKHKAYSIDRIKGILSVAKKWSYGISISISGNDTEADGRTRHLCARCETFLPALYWNFRYFCSIFSCFLYFFFIFYFFFLYFALEKYRSVHVGFKIKDEVQKARSGASKVVQLICGLQIKTTTRKAQTLIGMSYHDVTNLHVWWSYDNYIDSLH